MIPILLSFEGRKIAIFGGGNVGKRRAKKILKGGGKVDIYSKEFDEELKKLKEDNKNLRLIKLDVSGLSDEDLKNIIKEYDFILAAINEKINKRIVRASKELGKFINSSTDIKDVNFIVPAYTEVNDIIFCIYTKGKSPLVAKNVRILVENYLRSLDIDTITYTRNFLKEALSDQEDRKKILNNMFNNEEFRNELKDLIKKWKNKLSKKH